jgi:hypothetical protein
MAEPTIFKTKEEMDSFIKEKPEREYLYNGAYLESVLIDLCKKYDRSYTEFVKQTDKISEKAENPFVELQQLVWDWFNLDYTDFVDFPKIKKLLYQNKKVIGI